MDFAHVDIRPLELSDSQALFKHISNPNVMRFSRIKPNCVSDMIKAIYTLIIDENDGKVIARAIVNQFDYPIGMIVLWDIDDNSGFLATLIGEDYWGKGFNNVAKELFLEELFDDFKIRNVYAIIRENNIRSLKAMSKLSYVSNVTQRENLKLRTKHNNIEEDHKLCVIRRNKFNNLNRLLSI